MCSFFLGESKYGNCKRLEKLLAHQVHLAKKKSLTQNPPKQFYYSESRLLMDYPFEKMFGGMFLNKV